MNKIVWGLLTAAASLAAAPSHAALEALASYDRFDATQLDASHWQQGERRRLKQGGMLNLMQRDFGGVSSNVGSIGTAFSENLTDGSRVTQLRAKVTVLSASVSQCAENVSTTSNVLARVIGGFFNSGTPTSGNQIGDVLAQAWLQRTVSDPNGPLVVGGGYGVCLNADCSSYQSLGTFTGLGTAALGQTVTLAIEWDRRAKTFTAIRDGVTSSVLTYTISDHNSPAVQFKNLSTRTNLANCPAGATRSIGQIEATFDDVAVNRNGAP